MYHHLFNQPPAEGHLGFFQFGAITNTAGGTIVYRFSGKHIFLFTGVNAPEGSVWHGHMALACLYGTPNCFTKKFNG